MSLCFHTNIFQPAVTCHRRRKTATLSYILLWFRIYCRRWEWDTHTKEAWGKFDVILLQMINHKKRYNEMCDLAKIWKPAAIKRGDICDSIACHIVLDLKLCNIFILQIFLLKQCKSCVYLSSVEISSMIPQSWKAGCALWLQLPLIEQRSNFTHDCFFFCLFQKCGHAGRL